MACLKIFIVGFIRKEGFHPLYLEIHLDAMGQPFDQIVQAGSRLRIRVHRRADRRKQMRVIRGNDLVLSLIHIFVGAILMVPVFKNVGFFMLAVCGAVFILISLVDPEKVKQ